MKANADPDIQAADGATALFMATVHGHSEIIELLVKTGTDIWIKGPKGKTVVDVAESRRDSAVFRALRVPRRWWYRRVVLRWAGMIVIGIGSRSRSHLRWASTR